MTHCIVLDRLFLHRHWIFRIFIIDCHLVISLQFKTDIARESRAISVFTCSDITRDRCPLYQIVKDTSKIDNGYQLFQPAFGYKWLNQPNFVLSCMISLCINKSSYTSTLDHPKKSVILVCEMWLFTCRFHTWGISGRKEKEQIFTLLSICLKRTVRNE